MEYAVENVTTKKQLDNLYNNSAFTIEGLAVESIPDLINWLEENTEFTTNKIIVYIIKGNTMNEMYNLHNDNAYDEDLTIVSVVDIDLMKVALKRFSIGARWFDDIVDNNARREGSNMNEE